MFSLSEESIRRISSASIRSFSSSSLSGRKLKNNSSSLGENLSSSSIHILSPDIMSPTADCSCKLSGKVKSSADILTLTIMSEMLEVPALILWCCLREKMSNMWFYFLVAGYSFPYISSIILRCLI